MLIVNDNQLLLTGGVNLEVRCKYCSQPLTTYPRIMSDDAEQTVDHAACAVELATDILVDLFTFLSPPALYSRLFVLTASERKEWPMPLNRCPPDQGGARGASLPGHHTGPLSSGASGRGQPVEGAVPGDDPWLGAAGIPWRV